MEGYTCHIRDVVCKDTRYLKYSKYQNTQSQIPETFCYTHRHGSSEMFKMYIYTDGGLQGLVETDGKLVVEEPN